MVLFNSEIAKMEFSIFWIWGDLRRFSWKSTFFEEIRGDLRRNFISEEIWGGVATLSLTMLPQKMVIALKKFLHLSTMTSRKCVTLKYLTINCYHCSIKIHVLLIKFDDLQHLLTCTKKIDTIAISGTRVTKQVSLLNNLNLNNYSFEFTPT